MSFTVMSYVLLIDLLIVSDSIGTPEVIADPCSINICKIENDCRCSSSEGPLDLDLRDYPQLVSLTINNIITDDLYTKYWQPLLFDRVNPDGKPIGATFFVAHEYTNYQRVNDLFNKGFEIGVASITSSIIPYYWSRGSEDQMEQEFGGQKTIISKFANIPKEFLVGARIPHFQLGGNVSIRAYENSEILYDSSWRLSKNLFPYTLNYLSTQECPLGENICPNEAFPGFWILPINYIRGKYNRECDILSDCDMTGSEDDIANWLTGELDAVRNSTKAPLTLILDKVWFEITETSFGGLTKFLDNLRNKPDVFLVSQKQVMNWMKHPVPLSEFKTETSGNTATCEPIQCKLYKGDEIRYMEACTPCPDVYPWIGNPNGNN